MDDTDQSVAIALGVQDDLLCSLTCFSGPEPLVAFNPPSCSGQARVLQHEHMVEKHVWERKDAHQTHESLLSMSLGACIHARAPIRKSQCGSVMYLAWKGSNCVHFQVDHRHFGLE